MVKEPDSARIGSSIVESGAYNAIQSSREWTNIFYIHIVYFVIVGDFTLRGRSNTINKQLQHMHGQTLTQLQMHALLYKQ